MIFSGLISLLLIFYFVITPFINNLYFNPNEKKEGATIPEFNLVSAVHTELTQPYLRLAYVTNKNKGIGTYDIEKGYSSVISTNQTVFQNPTIRYTLKRGQTIVPNEIPYNVTMPIQHFDASDDDSMYESLKQQKLTKIKDLPSSSQLNVALSFKEPLTIAETLALLESDSIPSDSNFRLNWFSVANSEINLGMDWFGTFQILEDKIGRNDPYLLSLNKKYPNLFPGAPTSRKVYDQSKDFEEHFTSSLRYIIDNKELLDKQENHYSSELLNKVLEDANNNGIKINGVYLSGTPKAITTFGSKENIAHIDVQSTELYSDTFSDN
ncbi:anti sigma factor C-terminal domain-containing protein [Vagococcus fluvialis]|uniref:anti sigma factor C-terminal domain-containing protein n=2 Tax=Vagococcus fluvialis TaxID=2738 RepID=UPI002033BFDB|nr:anti sigma factor C-terminal domain-containing protein [Vagococcus fluvialis]MCM2138479.1 anti-sigma factor C-terminal domain-containing protein [Vagococcus fluvialis]